MDRLGGLYSGDRRSCNASHRNRRDVRLAKEP